MLCLLQGEALAFPSNGQGLQRRWGKETGREKEEETVGDMQNT